MFFQTLTQIVFVIGFQIFKLYFNYSSYILIAVDKMMGLLRKPTKACLPHYDKDYRKRYLEQRHESTFYVKNKTSNFSIPKFSVIVFIIKEFFANIIIGSPLLVFPVINYSLDKRMITSKKQLIALSKKLGLKDDYFIYSTDENCYELNTAFEIMAKVDDVMRNDIMRKISESKKYGWVDDFGNDEYYYQKCEYINDEFDIIGLFVPYVVNGNKKLKIKIILITDKKDNQTYAFQNDGSETWTVVRNNYINWARTLSSLLIHQVGCNIYGPVTLYLVKKHLHKSHPIALLLKPFLDGLYFTNNIFVSFGISSADTTGSLINTYMAGVELFDIQNERMITAVNKIHEKEVVNIIEYKKSLTGIEDIYFEQKDLLNKTYDMVYELVKNVVDYYYLENDYTKDVELVGLSKDIKREFSNKWDITKRNDLINFVTGIIYLSSIRHSQSHINFCFMSHFYEYGLRKTDFAMIVGNLKADKELKESMLYSTYGDFYSRYSSGVYPSVPLNFIEHGYDNLFDDHNVKGYFDKFVKSFHDLKKKTPRNQYTEFMFRMERSNTI